MAIRCPPSKAKKARTVPTKSIKIRLSDVYSYVVNRHTVKTLGKSQAVQDAINSSAERYMQAKDDINSGALDAPLDMYETPMPLAIWAQVATRIWDAGSVIVPFAGNGNLVFMANPNKNVMVNDTDAGRVRNLRKYGFHKVTSKNALSNDFQPEGMAEVVMVNPPLTPELSEANKPVKKKVSEMLVNTKIGEGYSTARSDLVGAFLALDKLDQDKGRAFVMVKRDKKNANDDFVKYLEDNKFKMQKHFVLDGKLYSKSGRSMPMEVFVINQTSKGGARLKWINSLDELSVEGYPDPDLSVARAHAKAESAARAMRLKNLQAGLNTKAIKEDMAKRVEKMMEEEEVDLGYPPPLKKSLQKKMRDAGDHVLQWVVEKFGSMITLASELNRRHNVKRGPDGQTVRVLPITLSTHGNGLSDNPNARFSYQMAGAHIEAQNDFMRDVDKDGSDSVEAYVAKHTGSLDKDVPYLTKEQLLEVGMSIRNHRIGKSIVIGSQTGMGKGRVMAMMAKYALKQGMKPVMVTQGSHLYLATARDMQAVKAWEAKKNKSTKRLVGLATNKGDDVNVNLGDLDVENLRDQKVFIKGGREDCVKELFTYQSGERLQMVEELGEEKATGRDLPLNMSYRDYDFVVTTYDQMQTITKRDRFERKANRLQRHRFLQELTQDGFFLFDESHLAGGSIQSMDEDSDSVAKFVRSLINSVYDHRKKQIETNKLLSQNPKLKVVEAKKQYGMRVRKTPDRKNGFMFASATFLKNSTSLSLYRGLGFEEVLTETQIRQPSFIDNLFGRYGGLNREQVAIMMARDGTYIRSENSWEGTTVSHETADTDPTKVEEISDILSSFFRMSEVVKYNFIDPLKSELEDSPKDAMGKEGEYLDGISKIASEQAGPGEYRNVEKISFTEFGSVLHQLLAVLQTAQKADMVIKLVKKGISEGKRPVIGLDHTNDAIISELIEMGEIDAEKGKDIDVTDVFRRLIDHRMLRIKYHYYTGEIERNKAGKIIADTKEDYIELTPELMAQYGIWEPYNDVKDAIEDSDHLRDLPLSPIDYIRDKLQGKEISVNKGGSVTINTGEITGRQRRLVRHEEGGWIYKHRESDETGPEGKKKVADKFQNGSTNVVIINRSGSTGIDLHADEKAANNEQRLFIMMEPLQGLVYNVQMVGRVGRYGQIWNPDIKFVWLHTPAGQRQKAMTEEGLKSIGATSSGQSVTPLVEREQAIEAEHIRGWFGDAAAVLVMRELQDSGVPVLEQIGMVKTLKERSSIGEREYRGIRNRLNMRLEALRPEWQSRILEMLDAHTTRLVAEAKAEGRYLGERHEFQGKVEYIEGTTYLLGHAHRQKPGRYSSFREPAMVSDFKFTATYEAETKASVVRHLAAVIAARTGQEYDKVINEAHGMKRGAEAKYHEVEEKDIDWDAMDKAINKLRDTYAEQIELWGNYDLRRTFNVKASDNFSLVAGEKDYKWVEELLAKEKVGELEIDLEPIKSVSKSYIQAHPFYKYYTKQISDAVRRMRAFDRRYRGNVQKLEEMNKTTPPKRKRANLIFERRRKRLANAVAKYDEVRGKKIEAEVKKFRRIDWDARKWRATQNMLQFGKEVIIKQSKVDDAHAYVLGIKHTSISEGGNPLSPNDWSVEVIGSNKHRRHTIPLNLVMGKKPTVSIEAAKKDSGFFLRKSLREGKTVIRPIITGNMLRAIHFLNRQEGLAAKGVPVKVRMGDSDVFLEGIKIGQSDNLKAVNIANKTESLT